jgi:hypothetical protein
VPALDFKQLEDAVTVIEQRTGLTRMDEWDTLLEQTAGTDPDDATTYRPYGVAALIRGNAQHEAVVLSAEGVQFAAPAKTLQALLATQDAWDQALELEIPTQWTVDKMREMVLPAGFAPPVLGSIGFG